MTRSRINHVHALRAIRRLAILSESKDPVVELDRRPGRRGLGVGKHLEEQVPLVVILDDEGIGHEVSGNVSYVVRHQHWIQHAGDRRKSKRRGSGINADGPDLRFGNSLPPYSTLDA
jgi:hypothetical protein